MELKFVICGIEHSGTTLVSDVFRQEAAVDSGFECGVLLGDSPKVFSSVQPFYRNMLDGWQISADTLEGICDTDSFSAFYQRLYRKAGFFDPSVEYLFDKTPRYFQHLFECQEKIGLPFIATYKDPRSMVFSDFKRGANGRTFEEWYEQYKPGKLRYLSSIYDHSYSKWRAGTHAKTSEILCVALEDICLNTRESLEKMFAHVGFGFDVRYLLMKNLRYSHNRAPQVSSRIPFEYLESLSKSQIASIEQDFSNLQDWFYE